MWQIEHRPGKFSRLLIVSVAIKRRAEQRKALSRRVFGEGRVIVNSRSANRRKIRSEWFEFLSRETDGRRDSGILMRHGSRGRLFSLFPRSRFLRPRCSYQGRTSRIWEVNRKAKVTRAERDSRDNFYAAASIIHLKIAISG